MSGPTTFDPDAEEKWFDRTGGNGRVDVPHLETFSAVELAARTFPPPRWAVPGVLAEGLTVLGGAPKVGKSWLAYNVAVAVASGGKALGRIDVDAGDVLYLALEDQPRRLQDRLAKILAGGDPPERLDLATACEAGTDAAAAQVDLWLDEHRDARLVVVDVLARVRGHVPDRGSRYEADYQAITAFKTVADRHGVAILVVHHLRKAAADDYLDTLSGTQGLAGAADAVLVLTRSRGSASALLKLTGRDVEEAEHALDFDPATGTWCLLDGPASDYDLSDTRRRILHLLRDVEGLTPKQIAERLDLDYETVKKTVQRMTADDQLDTDGQGHYFPVPGVPPVPEPGDTRDARDTSTGGTA